MGNRILKESICTSNEIDALTWFEEVFFYRLIVSADDYGVYPADPVVLAHVLFPKKENITRRMVENALNRLDQLKLITRYKITGKGAFLYLTTWDRHQRLRHTHRKYPAPEEAAVEEKQPEAEEKETEKEVTEEITQHETPVTPEAAEPVPAVITLPLNDGTEYSVTQSDIPEYASLYPAVDIEAELRAMRGWCLSNEKKRKTRYGIKRFINGWLARVQDKGGTPNNSPAGKPYPDNPYLAMACEGEAV